MEKICDFPEKGFVVYNVWNDVMTAIIATEVIKLLRWTLRSFSLLHAIYNCLNQFGNVPPSAAGTQTLKEPPSAFLSTTTNHTTTQLKIFF